MNLIMKEFKKLFNLKSIAMICIGFMIIYSLFISFTIEYFINGPIEAIEYQIAGEMLDAYGISIDENEINDFKAKSEESRKEVDNLIKNNQVLKSYEVSNYDEFKKFEEENFDKESLENGLSDELEDVKSNIYEIHSNEVYIEYEQREDIIKNYDEIQKDESIRFYGENLSQEKVSRIKEVKTDDSTKAPLPYGLMRNYEGMVIGFLGIVTLSIFFLMAGIFIDDKNRRVDYIQHSSKIGRKILKSKMIAGFLAAFIVTTVELIIMGVLYSTTGALKFWNCSINSEVFGGYIRWVDLSVGQFIILTIILTYVLASTVAAITMYISKKSNTYITVLGAGVISMAIVIFMEFMGIDFFATLGAFKYLHLIIWLSFALTTIIFIILLFKEMRALEK